MSDRLRAVSWFGDEKNQILKVVAFTALEWFKGAKTKITGDTGEKDAQDDLTALNQGNGASPPASFTDPEIGWPPKPLEPLLKPPLTGEGQWIRAREGRRSSRRSPASPPRSSPRSSAAIPPRRRRAST